MKQQSNTASLIVLGLIAVGSILSFLSKGLQMDALFWLALLCDLVALVLSIKELVHLFSKKNRTSS